MHVVQGCAQTLLNFASNGVTGVTDWLRSGLELEMRKFVHEMVLSNDRTADNDVNAAVDDVRMYAIERIVKES